MSNHRLGLRPAVNVHLCTNARILREKSHLVSPRGPSGAASMREIANHMSFHHREIGGSTYLDALAGIAVAHVSRKVPLRFRAMFTMPGSGQLPAGSCQLSVFSCQMPYLVLLVPLVVLRVFPYQALRLRPGPVVLSQKCS
jgi:hypothetical protein